jgi:uncharacterized repeat protein (TIGR01451 family)
MKKIKIMSPVITALIFLAGTLISLQFITRSVHAQTPSDIEVVKVLNQSSPVVRVGEFVSFTINITNNAGFSLTHATLFDDYEESILGSFSMVGGDPGPTVISPTSGELVWTDLISSPAAPGYFPELMPGQTISITIQFQVEHPPVGGFTIVNRAQIRDAIFSNGSGGDGDLISTTAAITGGSAPIFKQLDPPGQIPQVGDRITYTILLTNDGAVAITETVIVDTFDPAYLLFITSTPTAPTAVDNVNGIITWTNIVTLILPGQVISNSVVFEVLQIGLVNNRAETVSVRDFFGNDLAPGFGEVGIIIIADTPTPAPAPSEEDDDDATPIPTATATPFPTFTPTPMATQAVTDTIQGPLYLPETGWRPINRFVVPIWGLVLLTLGWYIARRSDNQ